MKKIILLLLSVLVCSHSFADVPEGNITFADVAVKAICVANWDTNSDGELSYAEAAAVNSIGEKFKSNKAITSFDEFQYFTGVTTIASYAFEECSNLTSIIIPDGVTSIGGSAFYYCSRLTSITISDGVTSIGGHVFQNCSRLTSINIPDGVTSIGQDAFNSCTSLTRADFSSIEQVCSILFHNADSNPLFYAHHLYINGSEVHDIVIPSGVTSIGNYAFSGCYYLTSIIIPESVTSIGNYAFYACSDLTSITIPESVTSIGNYAFYACSDLTSITIPTSVISIGESTFSRCSDLTSITIPTSVTIIGSYAFSDCSGLTSITIPTSVTIIGSYAFSGCSGLTSITIPSSVIRIESYAFNGCSSLTSINILNGVTSIGNYTFNGCTNLTSINIPSSVTSIGGTAFGSHNMIVNMASTTPCSQGGLGEKVRIAVPTSAVDAYKEAWSALANVIVAADHIEKEVTVAAKETSSAIAEEIGENLLINVLHLKVHGTINGYDLMVFRNKMINLIELDLSDANVVGNSYCYTGTCYSKDNVITGYFIPANITEIKLPKDITAIEANAFNGCSQLKAIILPEGVSALGDYAFYGCSQLKTITLPEGITRIPNECFTNCSALSDITIPESVTSIGSSAFKNCSSFTSIIIPDGVTSIGTAAFYGCSNLSYIYLPYYLQTIDGGFSSYAAFRNCSKITEMHLPPCLTSIGDNTFYGCSGLKDIYAYMPTIINIGTNTFNDYRHQNLYVPDFLYDQYYYDTNWSQFLSVNRTTLRPDDYKLLATNSDNIWKVGDQRIPDRSNGEHINGEVDTQGSLTVQGSEPQQFNELDQILDGEGKGGSLIGEDDGSTEGNLTANTLRVKINVKAGRWYFFCFPFNVLVDECEYPAQYAWRWYDGEARAAGNNGWKPVEGTTLTAGQGYAFQTSHTGNLIVTFDHPAFGGDRPKPLQAYASGNQANASWNFVGNPYSSFYDFIVNDFSSPITIYNANGTYTAYRPGDDDIHLQPYQAFFVQKPTEVASILFDSDRRETYRKSEEKKANRIVARRARGISPQRRLINLELLNGEEQMDRTRVVLNNEKSHAYELDCDAAKMMSSEAAAQLYSIENGINMAINERPVEGDIRLGYTAKAAGRLSISAPRMDMPMMLVDTELGTTFDLSLGSYDFDTAAGTFDGRFLLRASGEATAINKLTAKTGVCIGTQDGGLAIGGAEGKTVNIYTTSGAQAATNTGNGFIALKSGVYVVSVDGESAKIFVK